MKTQKLSEFIRRKLINIKEENNGKLFILCMQLIKDVKEKRQENMLNSFLEQESSLITQVWKPNSKRLLKFKE